MRSGETLGGPFLEHFPTSENILEHRSGILGWSFCSVQCMRLLRANMGSQHIPRQMSRHSPKQDAAGTMEKEEQKCREEGEPGQGLVCEPKVNSCHQRAKMESQDQH